MITRQAERKPQKRCNAFEGAFPKATFYPGWLREPAAATSNRFVKRQPRPGEELFDSFCGGVREREIEQNDGGSKSYGCPTCEGVQ
jgi:hypothetical protein